MSTLAKDTQPVNGIKGDKTLSFKVKNATAAYFGGLVALAAGYLKPFAAAAGEIPVGRLLPTPMATSLGTTPLTGDTSASPVPEGTVATESEVLINVPVTGVSAITDVGKIVYLSTDNLSADLTLTRPTRGVPVGLITRWYSSTSCDVMRFSLGTLMALSLAGNGRELVHIYGGPVASIANGTIGQLVGKPGRYRVVSAYAQVGIALAGGTSFTATLKKSGTTFTAGGVITFGTDAVGTVLAATAITQDSAAEFSESDTLDLVAGSVVGTYTTGAINVFALVERLPGV